MVCQQCGYHNEAGAEFCGSCGTFLAWAGETAGETAADGSTLPETDSREATAAQPVPIAPPAPPPSPTPVSASTQPAPAPPTPKPEFVGPPCPVCGKPVPKSRTFCPHCGADTRAPQAGARAAVVDAPPTPRRLPSIGIGPVILVGAFVVVVVGAVVFLPRFLGGSGPESQATAGPSASAAAIVEPSESAPPTESPAPIESPAPTEEPAEPSPTPLGTEPPVGAEAKAAIVSFVEEFDAAYRVGDSAFLIDHLDPAVISAYDRAACRKSIESFAKADFTTRVASVIGPAVWTYTPKNGRSTIISVAYTVKGERTRAGTTKPLGMHLSFKEGRFFWFASSC